MMNGAHISGCSENRAFTCETRGNRRRYGCRRRPRFVFLRGERLRQAKIENLHDAAAGDFDVRRLQISMHDALLVRGIEGVDDLPRDGHRVGGGQRSGEQPLSERRTFHQFEDQRG